MFSVFSILNKLDEEVQRLKRRVVSVDLCSFFRIRMDHLEPTDWTSAIQELLEKQGVDIRSEMEKK